MTWIDDRIAQDKAFRESKALIQKRALSLYDAIWKKLQEDVSEAAQKEILVSADESNRTVRLSKRGEGNKTYATAKEFSLTLHDSKESISASWDAVSLTFLVCVGPDGEG